MAELANILHPGPGYGGSCFPKDTQALVHLADDIGYDLKIVKAVENVNELQKQHALKHIKNYFGENLTGKTVAILGIAFKPNTDDIRESSSLVLIEKLLAMGAKVNAFDPEVSSIAQFEDQQNFSIESSSYSAAEQADLVILATEWNTFGELDLERLKSIMKTSFL